MTTPSALDRPDAVPLRRRMAAKAAVGVARLLAPLPPRRLRAVLGVVRRGARPADVATAKSARDAVLAASLTCLGPRGCLPRSIAVALLCRAGGTWPTWCVGVRVLPPFGAHAWVEADGRLVDEGVPVDYFRRLVTVPPVEPGHRARR
ncbi:Transglutaminase-like superfamily protein [Amycolatopsis arida]|uniref:Transglutaminase-like superfamily protein n=1 Tax=Amycolatopsis arida TaxID=587909 RepID=A0A1I5YXQ3_9PSEU|nr:lasso peptide biosynthesis B2 protein [Amycolatopsis arida]TDX89955.1 transglutaminase superfamily protein [Amycolatopsis arida]SFQ48835.1 Transglutaminase-like superfamily protein [Amycolatopsis arida]